MGLLIVSAIELYNQRPHNLLHGLSPNQMEEPLFLEHGNQHPKRFEKLSNTNDNSLVAVAIRQYKQEIAFNLKGD